MRKPSPDSRKRLQFDVAKECRLFDPCIKFFAERLAVGVGAAPEVLAARQAAQADAGVAERAGSEADESDEPRRRESAVPRRHLLGRCCRAPAWIFAAGAKPADGCARVRAES